MKLFSADIIFPVTTPPVTNGILALDESDIVIGVFADEIDLFNKLSVTPEASSIKKFDGFICPGFINAHCHVELSHLKNKIEKGTRLSGFIKSLVSKRGLFSNEQIKESAAAAILSMTENGIVAVGDISNTDVTFEYKLNSALYFHTFIEVFDLIPGRAEDVFIEAVRLQGLLTRHGNQHCSIVPHAPYSVSHQLFKLLASKQHNSIISVHNQETASENELFESHTGELKNFFNAMGNSLSHIIPSGKSSIKSYTEWMDKKTKTLFVHNTFIHKSDVEFVTEHFQSPWWCLCPKANLFIENTLPPIKTITAATGNIVLGTDSYASNDTLSILEEMKTIQKHIGFSFETLLPWATINGASFLNMSGRFGSFEKDKRPGINLVSHVDVKNKLLTNESAILKLS